MASSSERLCGTGYVVINSPVGRFDGDGPCLRVISFSAIRPTSLSLNTVLRLEARGIRAEVFGERQEEALRSLGGRPTRRRAVCLLLFDDVNTAHVSATGENWVTLVKPLFSVKPLFPLASL